MQLICDHFVQNLNVLDEAVAILECVEPPNHRIEYVLGLWRLNRLRRMGTFLNSNYDHLDRRIFACEYSDWFTTSTFDYVVQQPDTYGCASGVDIEHLMFLTLPNVDNVNQDDVNQDEGPLAPDEIWQIAHFELMLQDE